MWSRETSKGIKHGNFPGVETGRAGGVGRVLERDNSDPQHQSRHTAIERRHERAWCLMTLSCPGKFGSGNRFILDNFRAGEEAQK